LRNAEVPSIPAGFNCYTQLSSTSKQGAALVCGDGVICEQAGGEAQARSWSRSNAVELRARYPDVILHGICIVTKTWNTSRAWSIAWKKESSSLDVNFSVTVFQLGVKVGSRWEVNQASSPAWVKRMPLVSYPQVHCVVFEPGTSSSQLRCLTLVMEIPIRAGAPAVASPAERFKRMPGWSPSAAFSSNIQYYPLVS